LPILFIRDIPDIDENVGEIVYCWEKKFFSVE